LLWPPVAARIWALPGATAVTRPLADTVATPVLSELQITVRPVRTLPAASRAIAVACVVWASVMVLETRVTVTDATGIGDTVIDEEPS
jgi:hypothetical protein